jgi:hypothetical protein
VPELRALAFHHVDAIRGNAVRTGNDVFECRGGRYYAVQRGRTSRHRTRHPKGYDLPVPGPFKVVQPWGPDKAHQATIVSEHSTIGEAFAAIDGLSAQMVRTGAPSNAVEVLVVDADGSVIRRPRSQ